MSPGEVLVGFGFPAIRSFIHTMPIGSAHMSAAPTMFWSPGMQIHSLVPGRRTVMLPSVPSSATVASLVTQGGPASVARLIFSCLMPSAMIWECVSAFITSSRLFFAACSPTNCRCDDETPRMSWCLAGGVRGLCGGELGDLGAGGCDEFGVGVGVAGQAPPAVGCLGEQYPGPFGEGWVVGGRGDEVGELPDDGELLVAVERARVGEDLNPDIGAVAVHVGQRVGPQLMDERGGVLAEHGDVGHLLDAHQSAGQVRCQLVLVGEGAGGSVDVDHRHCVALPVVWRWRPATRPSRCEWCPRLP